MLARTRTLRTGSCTSDVVLHERVRAVMGHVLREPHKVYVSVDAGFVDLHGYVLPHEKPRLLETVEHVPGVLAVRDNLADHGWVNPVATPYTR